MSIFHKGKKKITKVAAPITTEELEDLPYAGDFDLPREETKLRAVYEHERTGGNFDIRKVFAARGTRAKTIAKVAQFPSHYDLLAMVDETYGGGTYNIHPAGSARVLKTYVVDGPPKYKPGGTQREKTRAQELKAEFEEQALRYALERLEDDPEMQHLVGTGMLQKFFGVEIPPDLDWKEQIFREGVEGDREYRRALVEAGLRKMGADFPEDADPLQEQINKQEQLERISELLGAGTKPPSLMRELLLALPVALPEILKIIQMVQSSEPAKSDTSTAPALETPSSQPVIHQPPDLVAPIENQEGRVYGLGQVSPEVAPPPEGLDPGPIVPPQPTSRPSPDSQPGEDAIQKPHISYVDWAELETGVYGDAGEFIRGVCLTAYERDSLPHHELAELFRDNESAAILGELSRLAESMWVESGKGEEYEVAVLVLKQLAESEEGRLWLAQAHLAAKVIQEKLEEFATGGVGRTKNGESERDSLDEEDEFDSPMLI
ncbi:MAG: hypothetical protein IIC96_16090 [Chloroflexi bacterium]|nr:hypothetical protein [Chloroflexota bacterium]